MTTAEPGRLVAAQQTHWARTYREHPDMYGVQPSLPARYALDVFARHDVHDLLELGAGQGRDTLPFLRGGLHVTALDFAAVGIAAIANHAAVEGLTDRLDARTHDVTHRLPLPAASVDAVYSHMLLCMAFSTPQLRAIAAEIDRVLRPGGLHVYTVRHAGDLHYRAGISHGDDIWEHGGFAVHYFTEALVEELAAGAEILHRTAFTEGELPRRLWQITQRKTTARPDAEKPGH